MIRCQRELRIAHSTKNEDHFAVKMTFLTDLECAFQRVGVGVFEKV